MACVLWYNNVRLCFHGSVSKRLRKLLLPRKTQIIPFELLAAIISLMQRCSLGFERVGVRHFVDSKPAQGCVVKGCSSQSDLNNLVAMLWFTAGHALRDYWCEYVPSKFNLADAPSRQSLDTMKQLGSHLIELQFDECAAAAEFWLQAVEVAKLV